MIPLLKKRPETLCLLRLSAIGDVTHMVPVVRTLQKHWPETEITWIIGKLESELVQDIPGVEFIVFDKQQGLRAYKTLKKNLHNRRFDLLLHMQASLRAGIASKYIKAPIKLGFDRQRAKDYQWLFTSHKIAANPHQHVLDGFFGFLEALGIKERDLSWNIPVSHESRMFVQHVFPDDVPVLVINPCTSTRARNWRNWQPDRYAAVADYAAEKYGFQVALTGAPTPSEIAFGKEITRQCHTAPVNLIGETSLKQLLALLDRAMLLIAPDTGPAHMATAVGTPVIGLYVTSNPLRTGPYLSQKWVINQYPEAIKAEYGLKAEEAPWGKRVRRADAMNSISINDVKNKLDLFMNSAGKEAKGKAGQLDT